jgi:alcohol dehydrogenase class IV
VTRFEHEAGAFRVSFGAGEARERIRAELDLLGARRILLIASERDESTVSRIAADVADRVVARFSTVRRHVPRAVGEAAVRAATDHGADAVLSIGGGSTTGTAKVVARDTGLPIVAVPTTYAGSEMTPVWGSTIEGIKVTGRDPRTQPRAVVYDPDLLRSLPRAAAGSSAVNALAHCVEAIWSLRADPLARAAGVEGARSIARGLGALAGSGPEAAVDDLLTGSMLGGRAFAAAGSGLHHKICHALGGAFDLPHAETHAVILPHVVAFTSPAAPEASGLLAQALGAATAPEGIDAAVTAAGTPRSLAAIGLGRDQLDEAVRVVRELAPLAAPRPADGAALESIVRAASGW